MDLIFLTPFGPCPEMMGAGAQRRPAEKDRPDPGRSRQRPVATHGPFEGQESMFELSLTARKRIDAVLTKVQREKLRNPQPVRRMGAG